MSHTLGDAPIEPRYAEQMHVLASALDQILNNGQRAHGTGFVLLVYPLGDDAQSRCNFISNGADPKAICALFREMIARFEGQPEIPAGHA